MKKFISLCLILLCSILSIAQTTNTFPTSGNVGIGTTSPSEKFQVNSTSATQVTALFTNSNTGNTYGVICGIENDGNGILWHRGNNFFRFGTNATERMRITANGNIGIGTSAPNLKFEVKSTVIGYPVNSGTTQTFGTYRIGSTQTGVVLDFGVNGGNDATSWIQATYSSDLSRTYNLLLNPNGGSVCIGSTKSFGYKLAVNGTIGAKEVKVENTSAWPDFVFKPNYNLRPLSEVEQFIKTNNHLPEIPSEAEVKENGIGLGEMNAKLLQKIEELTLYLIEKDKENKLQDQQIKILQDEIKKLKQIKNNN